MTRAIRTIRDIYSLKYEYRKYASISIDTSELKYTGALRYAIKYVYWALQLGGKLLVKDQSSEDDGVSKGRINYWQIKHEIFSSLKNDVVLVRENKSKGELELEKIRDPYLNNGISFGIVFSGSEAETPLLLSSIDSILKSARISKVPFEIIVSGPKKFDPSFLEEKIGTSQFIYLPFDFSDQNQRIMIAEKKAALYERCNFNIASITHTRIKYPTNFCELAAARCFDAFIPRVDAIYKSRKVRYLDYTLLASYNMDKTPAVTSLSGSMINANFMYFLRRRVPYMDGGINVFNKNVINFNPFFRHIAWGEGEDVRTASLLNASGALIDYFDDIECLSESIKIKIQTSIVAAAKRAIKQKLIIGGYM